MKTFQQIFLGVLFIVLFSSTGWGQTTYTWNGGTTDYQVAGNWTPSRTTPANDDVLLFNSGTTNTVTNIPAAQTIGNLIISNNTTVSVSNSVATILTIGGTASVPDLSIASGSALDITSTTGAFTLQISTGATGTNDGNLSIGSTAGTIANRILPTDAGSLVVNSGAVVTQGLFCSGGFFGNAGSSNVISFENGSIFVQKSGSNPFQLGTPNSRVQFKTGSLFRYESTTTPSFSGRTYPNFELNNALANITVTGGSAVTIDNLTITAGTMNFNMTGNPGHSIKGNIFVNTGATLNFIPASASNLNLSGTIAQSITINGNLNINSFSTITLNNANGLTLGSDILLNNLTLLNGKVTLGNHNFTCVEITGSDPTRYIMTDGTGSLYITVGTLALKEFPIGTAAVYAPIWLQEATGDRTYSVRVVHDASGSNSGEDRVKLKWIIDNITGGLPDATMKIQWPGSAEGSNFVRGTDAKFFDMATGNEMGSGLYTTQFVTDPYSLQRSGISTFSPVGIGPSEGTLPVALSSFNSVLSSRSVKLNWVTDSENNNAGFYVERINNEELIINNWKNIGFVKGNGTKSTPTSYTFEDRNLNTGKYMYRLKQVDVNGNYEYFELNSGVEIGVPKKYDVSQNYPNPFNPVTKINFDLPENGLVNIRLYDMLGREVAVLVNEVRNAGYHTVQFDASKLSSGIYFYKMNAGKFSGIKKMAVVK